jgi:hypothetical protein
MAEPIERDAASAPQHGEAGKQLMKRLATFAAVFILGGITGIVTQSATIAGNRARIVSLENELKTRNEKFDRCTDALINGSRTNAPQTIPPISASPK